MIGVVKGFRSTLGLVRQLGRFVAGYVVFVLTGRTPEFGYQSFRQLFCRTNGRINDVMSELTGVLHPVYEMETATGVLGDLGTTQSAKIAREIRDRGFFVFDRRLSPDVCADLRDFALDTPCSPVPPLPEGPTTVRYDPQHWLSTKYRFDEQALLELPIVQQLVSDPSILALAQSYLGAKPIQDMVSMWWSTARTREASSAVAQLYHFDMDRLKFIKFFFYLTDVDSERGPHCYIANSVRRKPRPLLLDDRIPDDVAARYYDREEFHELVGESGTIMAVDTRGFHKGKPLERGDRLILQLEFTNSLFGQAYESIRLSGGCEPQLAQAMRAYPRTYTRYLR